MITETTLEIEDVGIAIEAQVEILPEIMVEDQEVLHPTEEDTEVQMVIEADHHHIMEEEDR